MRSRRSECVCALLMSAICAAACGRKSVKLPIAAAAIPPPSITSKAEAEKPAAADRSTRSDHNRALRAPELSPSTGLLGSGTGGPAPVGTTSVVITQPPSAASARSGAQSSSNVVVSRGNRDGRRRDARRIVVASLVALGLIAAVLGVPRLTDS